MNMTNVTVSTDGPNPSAGLGYGTPSPLARDLDVLIEHLNAIQPEYAMPVFPVETGTSAGHPAQGHPNGGSSGRGTTVEAGLWDRFKATARHLTGLADSDRGEKAVMPPSPRTEVPGSEDTGPAADAPVPSTVSALPELPFVDHPFGDTPVRDTPVGVLESPDAAWDAAPPPKDVFSVHGKVVHQHRGLHCLDDVCAMLRPPLRASRTPSRFFGSKEGWGIMDELLQRHRKILKKYNSHTWAVPDLLCAYAAWCGFENELMVERAGRAPEPVGNPPVGDTPVGDPPVGDTPVRETGLPGSLPAPPDRRIRGRSVITSREIAELAGSHHDSVKRTIQRLIREKAISSPPKVVMPARGRGRPGAHYVFTGKQGKRDSMVVAGCLSAQPVVVQRWESTGDPNPPVGDTPVGEPPVRNPPGHGLDGLTMSSREIAERTGKQHKKVIRDIREMMIKLYAGDHVQRVIPAQYANRPSIYIRAHANKLFSTITDICTKNDGDRPIWVHLGGVSWSTDARGYLSGFTLNKEMTLTLVSGYDVVLRKRIINRWLELERQAQGGAFNVPQTLQEALRMAADLLDENQELKRDIRALRQDNETLRHTRPPLVLPAHPVPCGDGQPDAREEPPSRTVRTHSIREAAAVFSIRAHWFYRFLREHHLLVKQGTTSFPTPMALKEGVFTFREGNPDVVRPQAVLTEKGMAHIAAILRSLHAGQGSPSAPLDEG